MGGVVLLMIMVFFFVFLGVLAWSDGEGYAERVRHRRAMNDLELEKARRATEIEPKTKEWQGAATLEDLTEHRQRLKGELDDLHRGGEGGNRHA